MRRAELLSEKELADLLGFTISSVETLRCRGAMPKHLKLGRRIFYTYDSVAAWIADGGTPTVAATKSARRVVLNDQDAPKAIEDALLRGRPLNKHGLKAAE